MLLKVRMVQLQAVQVELEVVEAVAPEEVEVTPVAMGAEVAELGEAMVMVVL